MADGTEGFGQAVKGDLTGGCVCGAVRYILREGMRLKPYACHCTDCQSRSGSAFTLNMLFAEQDITIEGELDFGEYVQPSGARTKIYGCPKCRTRIYAVNDNRVGMGGLRCGTLDNSAQIVPAAHIWIGSKQPWIGLPDEAKTMEKQPLETQDWIAFVGLA